MWGVPLDSHGDAFHIFPYFSSPRFPRSLDNLRGPVPLGRFRINYETSKQDVVDSVCHLWNSMQI